MDPSKVLRGSLDHQHQQGLRGLHRPFTSIWHQVVIWAMEIRKGQAIVWATYFNRVPEAAWSTASKWLQAAA